MADHGAPRSTMAYRDSERPQGAGQGQPQGLADCKGVDLMRTILAALLGMFLPARGKRRSEPVPAVPTRAPVVAVPTPAVRAPRPADTIDCTNVLMVRPYLVAWEPEGERERKRDRRAAAVLATTGVDFLGVSA